MKKKKLLLFFCCLFAVEAAEAHDIITSRYSYHEHVLPILEAHCVRCHSPEGPAPFRPPSYLDPRPRAAAWRLLLSSATFIASPLSLTSPCSSVRRVRNRPSCWRSQPLLW